MAEGTSEIQHLSEKIIEPLRKGWGGNQLKINSETLYEPEVNQMLMKQRDEVEYMIRTYKGDDPLEAYYNYVTWLEQSFPRMELNNNFISLLENILTKFKDCQQYKQDIRFVRLLVKYITVQSNPIELYQLVYRQELGTKCSLLYISWAEELEKNNDFRRADHIYQIGINRQAQPLEELHNNHVQFQIKIARKMLEGNISVSISGSELTKQTFPRKLQSSTIKNYNSQQESSAVFEPFSKVSNKNRHDRRSKASEEKKNKDHVLLLNENKDNDTGRWVGMKQKLTSGCNISSFKISEAPCEVTKSVGIRQLKIKKEEFKCPVAVFEPPDPTKIRMYPKQLVYENGCDVQLEEIRAAFYWKKMKENESKEKYFQENCIHEQPTIASRSLHTSMTSELGTVPVSFNITSTISVNTELSTQNVRNPVDNIKHICPTPLQNKKSVSRKTIVNPINIEVATDEKTSNQEINSCSKLPRTSESVRNQTLSDSDLASKALPNSEISTRERSWYLATEFIKPVKLPYNEKNGFSCMNSKNKDLELITSSKAKFLKRKSNCMVDNLNSGLNQNDEFRSILENAKSTSFDNTGPYFKAENDDTKFVSRRSKFEDEIVNFINHCNRDNVSTFHHSPSASFTVNTRTAMNVIQKMWESPLAPRDSKMTKPDEDSDLVNLFRVPTILQSQCSKASEFADETENNLKLSTAHINKSNPLVKTEQKVPFPIFTDETKNLQTICANEEIQKHVINHNYVGTSVAVFCENLCKKPMIKVIGEDSFDVQKMKDSDFVKSRVPFSLFGEKESKIMTSQLRTVSTVHETEVLSKSITDLKMSIEEEAKSARPAPLIIPVKLQEAPPTLDNKENMPPEDYLFKHCERKPLSEIKVTNKFADDVSNDESFDEDTCSTRAFAISLPSSTPFARSNGYRKSQN